MVPEHGWRTFVLIWASQSLSVIGSSVTTFAITLWITNRLYPDPADKSRLALALSALLLSNALPTVLFAPFAGAHADRHDRRRTMIGMDLLAGAVTLAALVLLLAGGLGLPALVVIGAALALAAAYHHAAFDSSYALLVPGERLARANGMMQTIFALSGIVAPGLAATLVALPALAREHAPWAPIAGLADGTALALGIDSATFFFAAAVVARQHIPSPTRTDLFEAGTGRRRSLLADVRSGIDYLADRRPFLWLLGVFTLANFVAGLLVLQPLLVRFRLAPDWQARGMSFETAMAFVATTGSAGGVIGGIAVSLWGGLRRRRVYGVLAPLVVLGLAFVLFGATPSLLVAAAALGLAEGLVPIMNSHSQAIWQAQVPPELQGRVFSVRRLIAQASWPLSTLVMGVLAARFAPERVMMATGVLLTLTALAALALPVFRRIEDRAAIEAEAGRRAARRR